MDPDWQTVETPRLILRTLPPPALQALTAGDRAEASRLTQCDLSTFPDDQLSIVAVRLKDVGDDPDYLPWSLRVMALKPGLRFVGHFNFHSKPNADYLKELAPGAVEMGYFVLPEFRRQGLAEEAAVGMMDWAARAHGVGQVRGFHQPGKRPLGRHGAQARFCPDRQPYRRGRRLRGHSGPGCDRFRRA